MADLDAVVDLLERWRDSSRLGRLDVALDATRTIRSLPPAAKRELAIEIAERVAPQLVPQIRAEEGDLTGEQVRAVVDLLRRADRDQLDDLVTALRNGDVDGGLVLLDDTLGTVATTMPTGPDAPDDVDVDDAEAEAEADDVEAEHRIDGLLDDAIDALTDEDDPAGDVGDPRAAVAALDEQAVRAEVERAAAARAARWADTSRRPAGPAYHPPDIHFDIDFGDVELPDPTVEVVAPLTQRRDTLPGAGATVPSGAGDPRHGHLAAAGVLTGSPTPAVVAAITAAPDGYRRRRATLAAIREGRLTPDDVGSVIATLARSSDRAWVAGAAIDATLLDATALDLLDLTPAARRRLRARLP